MQFEFIDYSGCFPNLCAGKLTFKADGKQYAGYVDIVSGGDVWFDDHWSEHVELLLDAMRRLNKLILLIQMLWSVRPDTAEKLSKVKLIDPTPMIDHLAYLIQKSKDEDE